MGLSGRQTPTPTPKPRPADAATVAAMRRPSVNPEYEPPPEGEDWLPAFLKMLASRPLEPLRQQLGPDATYADAQAVHRWIAQQGRQPCSFLDEEPAFLVERRRKAGEGN